MLLDGCGLGGWLVVYLAYRALASFGRVVAEFADGCSDFLSLLGGVVAYRGKAACVVEEALECACGGVFDLRGGCVWVRWDVAGLPSSALGVVEPEAMHDDSLGGMRAWARYVGHFYDGAAGGPEAGGGLNSDGQRAGGWDRGVGGGVFFEHGSAPQVLAGWDALWHLWGIRLCRVAYGSMIERRFGIVKLGKGGSRLRGNDGVGVGVTGGGEKRGNAMAQGRYEEGGREWVNAMTQGRYEEERREWGNAMAQGRYEEERRAAMSIARLWSFRRSLQLCSQRRRSRTCSRDARYAATTRRRAGSILP